MVVEDLAWLLLILLLLEFDKLLSLFFSIFSLLSLFFGDDEIFFDFSLELLGELVSFFCPSLCLLFEMGDCSTFLVLFFEDDLLDVINL